MPDWISDTDGQFATEKHNADMPEKERSIKNMLIRYGKYVEDMDWKRTLHLQHKPPCLKSYSYEMTEGMQ